METELYRALDGLEACDLDGLTDAELDEMVVGLHTAATRMAAVQARLAAVWERRRVWAADGSKSPAARLARACRVAAGTAHRELHRARALRSMPATAAALAAGRINLDQVDLLIAAGPPEVAELFARDEAMLVGQAESLPFPDFRRVMAYWRLRADPDGAEDRAHHQHQARHLDAVRTLHDSVDIRGVLDPVNGTIVLNELERLEQDLFEADWAEARARHGDTARPEHLARTAGQRRADALVAMARRSAAHTEPHRPGRPLISVLVGYETFHGPICELTDGTVVTPGQVVSLLPEAEIERIVFGGPSRVIDVGIRQRLFTGGLRRAIEIRDRHCTHPGCDVPAHRCHVDHIIPWAMGGVTTQENGRLLCPVHNRRRHGDASARGG